MKENKLESTHKLDKNNKEIHYGDTVRYSDKWDGFISKKQGTFLIEWFLEQTPPLCNNTPLEVCAQAELEVTGSIYIDYDNKRRRHNGKNN